MITCIIVLVVVCDDQGGERKYLVSVHLLLRVLTLVRVLHYVYK